jgi:hypothetical protein
MIQYIVHFTSFLTIALKIKNPKANGDIPKNELKMKLVGNNHTQKEIQENIAKRIQKIPVKAKKLSKNAKYENL